MLTRGVTRVRIRYWSEWSDWRLSLNETCAGNTAVGRYRDRKCLADRLPLGVTRNKCIGSSFEYQRKTVQLFDAIGDQRDTSRYICNQSRLQLFTAFHFLCDGSSKIKADMVFWTDFRRGILNEKFYDSKYGLELPRRSPVWSRGQPDFHLRLQYCVEVIRMTLHDVRCIGLFGTNVVVCDSFEY